MTSEKDIQNLKRKWEELKKRELVESQHQKGKLSARERIDLLVDPETFQEINPFVETRHFEFGLFRKKMPGDGVISGLGKIQGRKVFVFSQDFSVMGGSLGEAHARKIVEVFRLAIQTGCPIIGILDSGGARIQEGIFSLEGYGAIFREQIRASGVIPQIIILAGPCAGGAAYSLALADFVFAIEGISFAFITGPEVIKKVTGETIDFENLGGFHVQHKVAGNIHFSFSSELDCILAVKKLFSFLPPNHLEDPPFQKAFLAEIFETKENPRLRNIIPEEETKSYEMKEVINEIFDKDSFFEIQKDFAPNVICAFCRLFGRVVGIVANQPKVLA
ncbi:MAG: acyl-CoA carboxylase subunit beta, partial [Minisyncoccales bacterium]